MNVYRFMHREVVRVRGRASQYACLCGNPATEWALNHTGSSIRVEAGLMFSEDVEEYDPLCRSCHIRRDLQAGQRTVAFLDSDPETLFEWRSEAGKKGAAATWSGGSGLNREKHSASARRNAVAARSKLAELQADPVEGPRIRARQSEGAKKAGGFQKRRCAECGRETNAPGLSAHQRATGHEGVEHV